MPGEPGIEFNQHREDQKPDDAASVL